MKERSFCYTEIIQEQGEDRALKSAKTRLGFTGLVVCGAADLYAWATTGQEVLAGYGEAESVLRLVENTFTSALGKLLVGAAAGGVGLWGLRGSRPKDQK